MHLVGGRLSEYPSLASGHHFPGQLCRRLSWCRFATEWQRQKPCCRAKEKEVWLETTDKSALTAALEAGATTFLFRDEGKQLAQEWRSIAKFNAVVADREGNLWSEDNKLGKIARIAGKEDLQLAEQLAKGEGVVVMDASDWQIIPAENLVAAFQSTEALLFGVAKNAGDARVLLEALEIGTDGVVLQSDNPAEVRTALRYVSDLRRRSQASLDLVTVKVTRVAQLGMGDRVAIDFCSLLIPGEGLLVGSYSRGLFLVHSECNESQYINSRPFRVNCGPVHAYVAMPHGKTAYLSEITAGNEVMVVDPKGQSRVAIVGRVKMESRPLVLVEASLEDGSDKFTIFLQNAETVRLVGPSKASKCSNTDGLSNEWKSIAVTELQQDDQLLVHRLEGARHTGISIQESIVER